MIRGLALVLSLALSAGCSGGAAEEADPGGGRVTRTRGGRMAGRAEPPPSTPPPAHPSSVLRDEDEREDEARVVEGRLAAVPSEEVAAPPAPEEAAPDERDLSAELSAAYQVPHDCFTYDRARELGETLSLDVSVTVMPSGRVNRASVHGARLTDTEQTCLEASAMRVSLRPPIEAAPRTVSTTIAFGVTTTPAEAPPP